jgi:hypothetical protein
MKIEIDTSKPWEVDATLFRLVRARVVSPVTCMIAARQHPEYRPDDALHLERQSFNADGLPVVG